MDFFLDGPDIGTCRRPDGSVGNNTVAGCMPILANPATPATPRQAADAVTQESAWKAAALYLSLLAAGTGLVVMLRRK